MKALATFSILFIAASASAVDTVPIRGNAIREMTTSPSYERPSSVKGITSVRHLMDGVSYTPWAGTLESGPVWVKFRFAGTRYISRVILSPGCTGSNRTFGEFGRPKTITFKAGERSAAVAVADRRKEQEFVLDPPLPAQQLTLEVTDYYRGRAKGVCLSEIQLHEQTALGSIDQATRERIESLAGQLGTETGGDAAVEMVKLGPAAVPRLAIALREKDETVQRNALVALHELGAPGSADALVNYWRRNPPTELRLAALRALARTGDKRGIEFVLGVMQSQDFDEADAAAAMTGQFGPEVIPALAKLLRSEHQDVQIRALKALSHIRHPGIVPLVAPFVSHRHSMLRSAAAGALAGSGDESGLGYLRALADDGHPRVRLAVARNADRFPPGEGQALVARLARDQDEFVARTAIETLARQPNGARHLAQYIAEPYAPLGREAVELLVESGGAQALEVMIDALRRGETRYRKLLRRSVAGFGAQGLEALFTAALEDDGLKEDAVSVLRSKPVLALKLVAPAIRKEASAPPLWLIQVVGEGRAPGSLALLDEVFVVGATSAKLAVVKAWGHYPAAAVRDRIMNAVRIPDPLIQEEAAMAGAQAGVRELIPFLTQALEDDDFPMARAIEGLGRLKDPNVEPLLVSHFQRGSSSMRERLAILRACKELQTKQCVRLLYGATNHPNNGIRHEAMRLIGHQAEAR